MVKITTTMLAIVITFCKYQVLIRLSHKDREPVKITKKKKIRLVSGS